MIEGRVTGLVDGAVVGWIAASEAEPEAYLEAVAEGEGPFGRARAEPGADGRLHFAIPVPQKFRDGRMRFLDVRPLGSERPLDGGPVIFDGGLFAPAPPPEIEDAAAVPPALVEGQVRFTAPNLAEGWAFAPGEPERRLQLEILAGGRFVTAITADQTHKGGAGGGDEREGHGFRVDLARLLRRGPHEVAIRVVGYEAPLPGGQFRAGPFAPDGEVDCPGYLDEAASRALIGRLPFEHLAFEARRITPSRLGPRLINRLRRERVGFAGGAGLATLLILPGGGDGDAERVWGLQSHPATAAACATDGAAAIRKAAEAAGYVFFARAEDLLHPSAAGIVARLDGPDVITWSRFCADDARAGAAGTVLRRPAFDPVTARHGAMTDTTLAVRGGVLAGAPDDVLDALGQGRLHPLWFWLAGQDLDIRLHPEALTSQVGAAPTTSRTEIEADEGVYRRLLAEDGGAFTLERTAEDLPFPYVLAPARRAGLISVLVPFRGRPAMTLRCIHALARQAISGELELVLVDNQSTPEDARAVLDGARSLMGEERVSWLVYDAPFNHSAQNNLAAGAARGEVVVLCNNDVVLNEPASLEQLAAWTLQPGVATVGCRLEDPERGLGSHGHILAPPSDDPFQPPLRENPDPTWGRQVHACPGNTLALAAIAREHWLELGGLDATRFPVGYNDLDFMLRASAAGLKHLYLGHLSAEHARGSSRTGDNEDLQALWINQRYPAAASGHLAQLANVRVETARRELLTAADPAEAELTASLQANLEQHRVRELKRAETANTLSRAAELVRRLGQELGE